MSETETTTPSCTYEGCAEPRWDGSPVGFCLYHAPENGRDEKTARKVWERARAKVDAADCDFVGWHFPRDPDEPEGDQAPPVFVEPSRMGNQFRDANFRRAVFDCRVDFSHAEFIGQQATFRFAQFNKGADFYECKFRQGVWFAETLFIGEADFRAAEFCGSALFEKARFAGLANRNANRAVDFADGRFMHHVEFRGVKSELDACFDRADFGATARFQESWFGADLSFLSARFGGDAFLGSLKVEGTTVFRDAQFSGRADVFRAAFDREVIASHVTFKEQADFREARFNDKAVFSYASFLGEADFHSSCFSGEADFSGCVASAGVHVDLPSSVAGRCLPFAHPAQGVGIYRLARLAAERRGEYRLAGWYNCAELLAIERGRKNASHRRFWQRRFWSLVNLRNVLAWMESLFSRTVLGFGERPFIPVRFGAAVIVVCGAIYWLFDGIGPDAPDGILTHLYFSVVTFTTLGYGDYKPATQWCQTVAGAEALTGAFLMAWFVVVLSRRYRR